MNIQIREMTDSLFSSTVTMITQLLNHHRQLNDAPAEYWQTDEQSKEALLDWQTQGVIYHIFSDQELVGFFYVRFGGQTIAWLEDLFIVEDYRHQGIGTIALKKLDELMIEKQIPTLLVDIVPRNEQALKLYRDCGFDHLNLIQLRKNYDFKLNKEETVDVLGFRFKKY